MALSESIEYDKIEIVGIYKHVQVRKATVIKKDGKELTRSFERYVLHPDTDISAEPAEVTVINTLAALSSLTDEQKDEITRNVQHLEIIKAYKKEDGKTSIWTTEDFTAQDAAVALGKTKY